MSEAKLLAAVRAGPDDEGARRVYADWLGEQGRAEEAEHLIAGWALARDPADHASRLAAYRSLPDLQQIARFPDTLRLRLRYEGGLARVARLSWGDPPTPEDWAQTEAELRRIAPCLERLELHGELPPRWSPIPALRIAEPRGDWYDALPGLLESSAPTKLAVDPAYDDRDGEVAWQLVGEWPGLRTLRELEMRGYDLDPRPLRGHPGLEVLGFTHLPDDLPLEPLRRLRVSRLGRAARERVASCPQLEHLALHELDRLEALPASLRSLAAGSSPLPHLRALARSRVEHVAIETVTAHDQRAWAEVLAAPALRRLDAGRLAGSAAPLAAACKRARRGPVELRFGLADYANRLTRAELAAIAGMRSLRALELIGDPPEGGLDRATQLTQLSVRQLPQAPSSFSLSSRGPLRLPNLELLAVARGDKRSTQRLTKRFPSLRHLETDVDPQTAAALDLDRLLLTCSPDRLPWGGTQALARSHPRTVIASRDPEADHVATLAWWRPPA